MLLDVLAELAADEAGAEEALENKLAGSMSMLAPMMFCGSHWNPNCSSAALPNADNSEDLPLSPPTTCL